MNCKDHLQSKSEAPVHPDQCVCCLSNEIEALRAAPIIQSASGHKRGIAAMSIKGIELSKFKQKLLIDVPEQERDRLARECARLTQHRVSLEAQKSELSSRIGSEIKRTVLAIATAAHVVETGKRLEDVDCADNLIATNVHRIRLDTGEVIETRAATPDELQQALPFGKGRRERAEKT